jgi:hypothetical protein
MGSTSNTDIFGNQMKRSLEFCLIKDFNAQLLTGRWLDLHSAAVFKRLELRTQIAFRLHSYIYRNTGGAIALHSDQHVEVLYREEFKSAMGE